MNMLIGREAQMAYLTTHGAKLTLLVPGNYNKPLQEKKKAGQQHVKRFSTTLQLKPQSQAQHGTLELTASYTAKNFVSGA